MKKMFKAVALTLSMVAVLSVAGCGKKEDPKAIFDAAIKKNAEMTDMDMDSNVKMNIAQGEQTMDMETQMKVQISKMNTEEMVYLADSTVNMMGQNVAVNMFYTDGYFYMETQGQKMKYPMDLTKIMETVKQSTETTSMSSEEMKDIKVKKDGDNQVISFTADPEKLSSYVDEMMSSMGGNTAGLEGMEMTIKEASGEYVVNKDGYYTSMKMKMVVDMTMQGQSVTMTMDVDGTINNPGQAVEITLPSTDGYQEIDPVAMGLE